MGSLAQVVTYGDDSAEGERISSEQIVAAHQEISRLGKLFTDYDESGPLQKVCGTSSAAPELQDLLQQAIQWKQETKGAFDPTIGVLVKRWRAARNAGRLLSEEEKFLHRQGDYAVRIRGGKISCGGGVRFDLGGIAKGYIAQRVLQRFGNRPTMFALSGDIAVGAAPPGRDGWVIESQQQRWTLRTCCISTSGDQNQFLVVDGVRYSHVIDPRTAEPLTDSPTVTVIGRSGATCDALATAGCLLTVAELRHLARKHRLNIIRDGEVLALELSTRFARNFS
jgi:FAD:protein FMN transferase